MVLSQHDNGRERGVSAESRGARRGCAGHSRFCGTDTPVCARRQECLRHTRAAERSPNNLAMSTAIPLRGEGRKCRPGDRCFDDSGNRAERESDDEIKIHTAEAKGIKNESEPSCHSERSEEPGRAGGTLIEPPTPPDP